MKLKHEKKRQKLKICEVDKVPREGDIRPLKWERV